ncbi:FHA domain-containing protein [Henriciella mobilis]|nr:FHA domain-containing protein [Henriciella mobilis]
MSAPSSSHNLPERTQQPCCYTSALEEDATFCGECGKPLIRCMAFEECGGLLDDAGRCTVCVSPHLQMAAGAQTEARIGGAVAIPLLLANRSGVGRPLFVTSVWSSEGYGEWREVDLGWERLHAGEQRPFSVRTDPLGLAGIHGLEVLIAVSSHWRWRQEAFVFAASLTIEVKDDSKAAAPVVNIGGQSAGHGNTVYISGQGASDTVAKRSTEAVDLALVRAEKHERRLGLRGTSEMVWVPRGARLAWEGFPDAETPFPGPILTSDGILSAGRSRTRSQGGPGDIRLLVRDEAGNIDRDLSQQISRRHFELYIECDRLILRVTGGGGVSVNGKGYGRDKTVVLSDGDEIAPLRGSEDRFRLKTRFHSEHGRVTGITFQGLPPVA